MIGLYAEAALLLLAYMHLAFLVAWRLRDNSLADIAWGLGFVVLAVWFQCKHPHPGSWVLTGLIALWGIRLAAHIGWRKLQHPGEDWRYARWREEWGKHALWRGYVQVFLLQGLLLWGIAAPIWQRPGSPFGHWVQWIGLAIWATGFYWEAVSDWQLLRFKAEPGNKGKIMRYGLWKYSRHPNYFGEILVWWGIFAVALPWGYWPLSLISPLLITWLLARVSGVPMLESKYRENRAYQEYVRDTPGLVPDIFRLRRKKGFE